MAVVDLVLLGAVLVSALVGVLRGFVKEAVSLAVWIGAFWCALRFGEVGEALLAGHLDDPLLLRWGGRLLVFVVVLFAGTLLGWLAGFLIRNSVLTGPDRMLGLLFGVARGVVVAALVVMGLNAGGFDDEPWWQRSKLIPYAAAVGAALREFAGERLDVLAPGGRAPSPPAL